MYFGHGNNNYSKVTNIEVALDPKKAYDPWLPFNPVQLPGFGKENVNPPKVSGERSKNSKVPECNLPSDWNEAPILESIVAQAPRTCTTQSIPNTLL